MSRLPGLGALRLGKNWIATVLMSQYPTKETNRGHFKRINLSRLYGFLECKLAISNLAIMINSFLPVLIVLAVFPKYFKVAHN